jgi:5'-3' exonuclease
MGVPGFYYKLKIFSQKNPKNNFISKVENMSPDCFLLDTNCLLHPVCFKVVADNPNIFDNEILESIMFKTILEYLDKLIEYVNPQKCVYIAIDGVAPVAKIKQQRIRRFKSVSDKVLWDNIKKKHGMPINSYWNNSAITPGTKFMELLHIKILEWIETKNNINIIYSSYLEPGEGEHKLLQYIRNNSYNSHVIYGLDADLIFLALSTQLDNIYLLREENDKSIATQLNYVDIKLLKQCIIDMIKSYNVITNLNDINLINDFIFMCYFLGNDFLPHIQAFDIYKDGIELLIINYVKTINELKSYLLDNTKINLDFFKKFISNIALEEESILKNKYYENRKKLYCDGNLYEKEVFKIENLLFKIEDPIKLGFDNLEASRIRYYKYYFQINENNIEEFSENLVKNYIIGLKWILLYYFDKCPSYNWYYPYDHPPFIFDIYKYINVININKIKFKLGEPLEPNLQLLTVLPPQSNYLLPNHLKNIIVELKYLYPYKFEQDFINKTKYWMGIPYLPPLNIKLIKYTYEKYKNMKNIKI